MLQAGGGAWAIGGESGGGVGSESCGEESQGSEADGVGLCGGSQIEQLCEQEVWLRAECQQSDCGGALFCGECRVESSGAGVVDDVVGEGECIWLIVPGGVESAATAAESFIECSEQFGDVL